MKKKKVYNTAVEMIFKSFKSLLMIMLVVNIEISKFILISLFPFNQNKSSNLKCNGPLMIQAVL